MTRAQPARSTAVACAVALLLGPGCARLVTVDPETVATRNDVAWRIQPTPVAAPPPVVAPPAVAEGQPGETPAPPAEVAAPPAEAQPSPPAPVVPLSFRMRPQIQEALATPPDALGVPTGLYALDPLLVDHRREMESQASARHSAGAGLIVFGAIFAGLAGVGISIAQHNTSSPDQQVQSSAAQTMVWSLLLAGLSAGEIVAGIAMAASDSDPRPLQSYYRETYSAPR